MEPGGGICHAAQQRVFGPAIPDWPADEASPEARHGPAAEREPGERRGEYRIGCRVAAGERIDRDNEHRGSAGDERDGQPPRPRDLHPIDDTDAAGSAVLARKPAGCREPPGNSGREVGNRFGRGGLSGRIVVGFSRHRRGAPG